MKSFVSDFHVESAKDLKSALTLMSDPQKNYKPLAGGTDIMVLFEAGKLAPGNFLDISRLDELKGITVNQDAIEIGALVTYSEVLENPILQKEFSLLCEAAKLTGAVAIQNRGTLGGNIINASPAADSPPALLVYDTKLQLTSQQGSRWVDYSQFHVAYKKMDLRPGELLTRIRIERNTQNAQQFYRKVGTRKSQAISKVCIAAVARKHEGMFGKFRIALGSVAPIPLRCFKTEQILAAHALTPDIIAKACVELSKEISPVDDIRSDKEYRRRVAVNLLRDFLEQL